MARKNIIDLGGFHFLVHGRHGHFVANKEDIYVGGALITYGEFSENETEFFRSVTDKDTTVIEAGANIGAHTVMLAKASKRVIAVEPQPFIYYTLCSQVVLNSLQNVDCVHAALSNEPGVLNVPRLDYSKRNNFGGIELDHEVPEEHAVKVPMRTLDEICADVEGKVFLKVDVEGMELKVLQGAEALIQRTRPVMYVENDRKDKADALLEYIYSLDYEITPDMPMLFNKNNYFKQKMDKYPNIASWNIICRPK